MEKVQSKFGRSLTITLCVALFCAAVFYMYFSSSVENVTQQLERVSVQLDEAVQKQQALVEEVKQKEAELEEYSNLDARLVAIQKEYFENAVKVDLQARNGEADYKVAYLTFDDGPYLLTDQFLDVLEEKGVQATFFLRKRTDSCYDNIYRRYITGCHTIGNHTAYHDIFGTTYSSESQLVREIQINRDFIYEKLGYTTEVIRFPGGSNQIRYSGLNKSSAIAKVTAMHYAYVDWTVSCGDGGANLTPEGYYNNIVKYTPYCNTAVILMHDYNPNTLAMLPNLIDELRNEGYIFLPLSYNSPAVSH